MSISQDKNLQNILDILKQHPTATAKQLAQILHDIPIRTLQYRLKRLVEAQHVLQIGKGPAAKYQLPPTKAAPIIAISKKGGEIQNSHSATPNIRIPNIHPKQGNGQRQNCS